MDFTQTSAAFYLRGLKAQLFLKRESREETGPAKIAIFASSRRQLEQMDSNLQHIERFFPGLRRVNEEINLSDHEPTQVLFAGSCGSLGFLKCSRDLSKLLLQVDAKALLVDSAGLPLLNLSQSCCSCFSLGR